MLVGVGAAQGDGDDFARGWAEGAVGLTLSQAGDLEDTASVGGAGKGDSGLGGSAGGVVDHRQRNYHPGPVHSVFEEEEAVQFVTCHGIVTGGQGLLWRAFKWSFWLVVSSFSRLTSLCAVQRARQA